MQEKENILIQSDDHFEERFSFFNMITVVQQL